MPAFSSHQSSPVSKIMLLGDSGSGKTGALACLANAGYKLRILDFDNGLDILHSYLTPEGVKNINYVTLTDSLQGSPAGPVPAGMPTAFSRAVTLLNHWKTPEEDLGPLSSWTPEHVLVIDSITFMSDRCLDWVCALNGRLGQHPQIQDYGVAADKIEKVFEILYSPSIKCNVIGITHITYMGGTGLDDGRGYPMAIGKKLPPKLPRYFNTVVRAKTLGAGAGAKRSIIVTPEYNIDLKSTVPKALPNELPLESGLLTIFEAVKKVASHNVSDQK